MKTETVGHVHEKSGHTCYRKCKTDKPTRGIKMQTEIKTGYPISSKVIFGEAEKMLALKRELEILIGYAGVKHVPTAREIEMARAVITKVEGEGETA